MTELETKIYISLRTCSRRALKRVETRYSRKHKSYWPRRDLINRLCQQFNLTETEAYTAMLNLRRELSIPQRQGF